MAVEVTAKPPRSAGAPTAVSVGVASTVVVERNAARRGLVLVNTSAARISLAFGGTAVLDSGITLYPNGGTFMMNEWSFSAVAVNAIASAPASNLAIEEFS